MTIRGFPISVSEVRRKAFANVSWSPMAHATLVAIELNPEKLPSSVAHRRSKCRRLHCETAETRRLPPRAGWRAEITQPARKSDN